MPVWWNKNVPQECLFCHSYQQKMGGKVSFYFLARFCTNQPACQQLCDLFSRLSRLLTWQVLKLPSISGHHLMSSQLFLWLLVWIRGRLAPGSPKLPSVSLTGFLPFFYLGPHTPFPQTASFPISLAFEVRLLWLAYCPSSWLPGGWLSIRNPAGLLSRSCFLAGCLFSCWVDSL